MTGFPKVIATLVFTVLGIASQAHAFDFGTKFTCCRSQNVSCVGSGGAMIWQMTLKDRALTQADAKLRCGFDKMQWNTHSCPADQQCNSEPGTPSTPVTQVPASFDIKFRNNTNNTVFLALKTWEGDTYRIRSWFEVKAHQDRSLVYKDNACLAIQANGRDYIADQKAAGSIFTGTISSLKAHPQNRTDLDFGLQQAGKYWVTLFVANVFAKQTFNGYSPDNVRALMDQAGLISYQCHQVKKSAFIVSAD